MSVFIWIFFLLSSFIYLNLGVIHVILGDGGFRMIAKETVLNKMLKEIQLAKTKVHDEKALLEHVRNVQLLSELMIEAGADRTGEVKGSKIEEQIKMGAVQPTSKSKTDDDGMSIFDF